jgi:hypothetical protein
MKNNFLISLLFKCFRPIKRNISVFCSTIYRVRPHSFNHSFATMKLIYSVFAVLFMSTHIQATIFTVNNLNDAGTGSLRQAISSVNSDLTATPSSPHIINVTQAGTIFINTPLDDLDNHVTINGNAALTTVYRATASSFRVLTIKASRIIEINNVKFENGSPGGSNPGGGLYNDGSFVTLNNCIITDNFTGAAAGGHGGGLAQSTGTMTLNNSTIKNNDSGNNGQGGGIYIADGTVSLFNCTVQNNSTGGNNAGAIMVDGSSTLNLTNCTVIQNYSANNTGFSSGGVFLWIQCLVEHDQYHPGEQQLGGCSERRLEFFC